MEKFTEIRTRTIEKSPYLDTVIRRDYINLKDHSCQDKVIDLMDEYGVEFLSVGGSDLHDIGDRDWFSGSEKTSDPVRIKEFIRYVDKWSIDTSFQQKIIEVGNNEYSGDLHIWFEYPEKLDASLSGLFQKIEENCCVFPEKK